MSKEELGKISNHNVNNYDQTDTIKNLCVHDLRRRLKDKQRKENIIKGIIFLTLIFLIGSLSLFFN